MSGTITARGAWGSLIRTSAFLRKELVGVLRQPSLVLTLVLGPFLILLLFGSGLQDAAPAVRTEFIAPEGSEVAEQARQFAEAQDSRLVIEEVASDLETALRRLEGGELDLVVEFPADIDETLSTNRRPALVFYHDYLDPIEAQAMIASMRTAVDEVNQQVAETLVRRAQRQIGDVQDRVGAASERTVALRAALARGDEEEARRQLTLLQGQVAGLETELDPGAAPAGVGAGDTGAGGVAEVGEDAVRSVAEQVDELSQRETISPEASTALQALAGELESLQSGLEEFGRLPPGLFVSPFRGVAERVVEGAVDLTDFYAPAVLVLLAQHLAVTFIGLSIVRDRQLGTTELFRVAPLTAAELLAGKCLAYLLLTGAVTAIVTGLLVTVLDVPMRGSWWALALIIGVLLLASVGLGFVLALLAGSASQAVQYAMLLLLLNVFFSGFLLTVDRFAQPVQAVPWLLPATYGVRLLRDVMLRGDAPSVRLLGVLAGAAVVLLVASGLLTSRRLLRA